MLREAGSAGAHWIREILAATASTGTLEGTVLPQPYNGPMRRATDTVFRHLAMLTAIPVHPKTRTTSEIHDALRQQDPDYEVSVRSVQRSLESLSVRFPITSELRGRTNHWCWIDRHALTQIPAMSESTAFVLRLASDYLKPLMPTSALRRLEPYFRHAEEVLSGTGLGRWVDHARIVGRGPVLKPPAISDAVQEAVTGALLAGRQVEVDYRNKAGARARRIALNPLGVVLRDGVVYLVATSWDYDDVRHYVLHRMSNPTMLEAPARRIDGFRMSAHIREERRFAYPVGSGKLRLKAVFERDAALHLMESRLGPDHRTAEAADGRVLVEATVADTAELRWWLLGFGSAVEVVEPASLREEFREQATELNATYR